jgi:hypothetical protein
MFPTKGEIMIKTYWNDALLILAALLPVVHPIDAKLEAGLIIALAAYGIVVKYKSAA